MELSLVDGHPVQHVCVLLSRGGFGLVSRAAVGCAQKVYIRAQADVSFAVGDRHFCAVPFGVRARVRFERRVVHAGSRRVGNAVATLSVHLVGEPGKGFGGGQDVGVRFGTRARKRLEPACTWHVGGAKRGLVLRGTYRRPGVDGAVAQIHLEVVGAAVIRHRVGAGYRGAGSGIQVVGRVAGGQRQLRVVVHVGIRIGQRRRSHECCAANRCGAVIGSAVQRQRIAGGLQLAGGRVAGDVLAPRAAVLQVIGIEHATVRGDGVEHPGHLARGELGSALGRSAHRSVGGGDGGVVEDIAAPSACGARGSEGSRSLSVVGCNRTGVETVGEGGLRASIHACHAVAHGAHQAASRRRRLHAACVETLVHRNRGRSAQTNQSTRVRAIRAHIRRVGAAPQNERAGHALAHEGAHVANRGR